MIVKKGTVGKVKKDFFGHFHPGDTVVALENDVAPFCCLKEDYKGLSYSPREYPDNSYWSLLYSEVDWEG